MNIEIRLLQKKDYKKYIKIINDFREFSFDINTITQSKFDKIYDTIFKNSKIFVALYENNLVGTITCLIEQKFIRDFSIYVHIEDFFILEDFRNKKIGKLLLQNAINYSKKIKAYKIILNCSESLINYYNKYGFITNELQMIHKL